MASSVGRCKERLMVTSPFLAGEVYYLLGLIPITADTTAVGQPG